ncbi:MAG: DUF547 domain-containing protein [Cyanobacteria bacterium J06631_9]
MIDFTPWDRLLQKYVKNGQVDYTRWKDESLQPLESWLQTTQTVALNSLNEEAQIAFLINLYNALTIRQVLQKYPIDSIRPTILGVPNLVSFLQFFKQSIHSISKQAGKLENVSLDNIEHDILRANHNESRIHFALVCASGGCPRLRSHAYFPEQLNEQLSEDAKSFITNSEKVRYEATSQTLYCSKLFKWYEADFLAKADSIAAYIQPYLNVQLPATVTLEYLPYSWQLNDQRISS